MVMVTKDEMRPVVAALMRDHLRLKADNFFGNQRTIELVWEEDGEETVLDYVVLSE